MGFPDDHLAKSFRYLPKYHQKVSSKSQFSSKKTMSGNSVQNQNKQNGITRWTSRKKL